MAQYKLTYFDCCGMGESIRYMFIVAGVPFEDDRVKFADWADVKPKTPFGLIPTLEFEGNHVGQAIAICRFLGSRFGLVVEDEIERLRADVVADTLVDLRAPEITMFWTFLAGDKEKLAELAKKYEETTFPAFVGSIEKFTREGDFFAGSKMTWVDIFISAVFEFLIKAGKLFGFDVSLDDYPKLKAIQSRVFSLPNVVEYRKNRPLGEFAC